MGTAVLAQLGHTLRSRARTLRRLCRRIPATGSHRLMQDCWHLDLPATGTTKFGGNQERNRFDNEGSVALSVDSFQDQAITCNLGQSAFGASLFLVFAPSHLFVPEKVSVTVAAITVALIGGAYVGFGALVYPALCRLRLARCGLPSCPLSGVRCNR